MKFRLAGGFPFYNYVVIVRLLLTFISISLFNCAVAQYTITGTVTDTVGNPISNASIKALQNGIIKAYAFSQSNGLFKLTIGNAEFCELVISHIGYTAFKKTLEGKNQRLTVTLNHGIVALPQINIQTYPISQKGDTIVYEPRSFADRQDKFIGDVIKKLPGINVTTDGQISFNGKPISHYYIDGLDMLGRNYGLANANIQLNDVDKVQVLENHQDKQILDSIESGSSPALNLQLKASSRNKLIAFANANIGQANNFLYNTSVNAMQFSKNIQFLHGIKLNNNGENIAREITEQQTSDESFMDSRYKSLPGEVIKIIEPAPPLINERFYFFNSSVLAYTNALFAINKTDQVKYQVSYLNQRVTKNLESQMNYYFPMDTIRIFENHSNTTNQNLLKGNIYYTRNSQKTYLNNNFKVTLDWSNTSDQISNKNNLSQYLYRPNYQLDNELIWYKKIKGSLIRFQSQIGLTSMPQFLSIKPGPFSEYFNNDIKYERLSQFADKWQFFSTNSVSFLSTLFHFKQKYRVLCEYQGNYLESHLEKKTGSIVTILNDSFKNNLRQRQLRIEPQVELIYTYKTIIFNLLLPVNLTFLNRIDTTQQFNASNNQAFFSPRFNVSKKIGNYLDVNLNLAIQNEAGNWASNTLGYLLNNYRSIIQNDYLLNTFRTRSVGIHASYKNVLKGVFGNCLVSYGERESDLIYQQTYIGILLSKSAVQMKNSSSIRSVIFTAGKYIPLAKTNISLNFNLFNTQSFILQNNTLQPIENNNIMMSGIISCKKIHKISLENSFSFSRGSNKFTSVGLTSKSSVIDNLLSLNYFINDLFTVSTGVNFITSTTEISNKQHYFFINSLLYFTKKKHSFVIKLNNLTNNKTIVTQNILQNMTSKSSVALRPLTITLQYDFKFQ
ncbi:MAG: carboxypeptidase regulatory-like domain-containing protein [Chitinophagaceae bacterium]|nr:carboxypeptidase regulatory-like domain-containing protein [Chitinophagaceae bacterium]